MTDDNIVDERRHEQTVEETVVREVMKALEAKILKQREIEQFKDDPDEQYLSFLDNMQKVMSSDVHVGGAEQYLDDELRNNIDRALADVFDDDYKPPVF